MKELTTICDACRATRQVKIPADSRVNDVWQPEKKNRRCPHCGCRDVVAVERCQYFAMADRQCKNEGGFNKSKLCLNHWRK